MQPYTRPSKLQDVVDLAPNLRPEDELEVNTLGHTPEQALCAGYLSSTICKSIIDQRGQVVGMYGVCALSDVQGQVWMLGSKGLLKIKIAFLKQSRKEVEMMNNTYAHLCNIIDSRNGLHLKWIQWCGFKIIGEKVINNVKFFEFCKAI